jgi:WD40 repeat protein
MLLKTVRLPAQKYRDIVFGCDNNLFAANSLNEIIIGNIYNGQQTKKITSSLDYFSHITFSSDGRYILIVDSHKKVELYDLGSFEKILSFEEMDIFDIAIDFSSELIAISNHENNKIRLWDIKSNKEILTCDAYEHSKCSVSFRPNAKVLALGDYYSGQVGLLDITSEKLTRLLSGIHSNGDLVFSNDGKLIAGESYYRDAVVDVASGNELKVLEEKEHFHTSEITSIAFSSDNKLVASGSYDLTIRLWNVDTGKQIKKIEGHKTTIFNLLFTNTDQTLISASADCTIRFWQI